MTYTDCACMIQLFGTFQDKTKNSDFSSSHRVTTYQQAVGSSAGLILLQGATPQTNSVVPTYFSQGGQTYPYIYTQQIIEMMNRFSFKKHSNVNVACSVTYMYTVHCTCCHIHVYTVHCTCCHIHVYTVHCTCCHIHVYTRTLHMLVIIYVLHMLVLCTVYRMVQNTH